MPQLQQQSTFDVAIAKPLALPSPPCSNAGRALLASTSQCTAYEIVLQPSLALAQHRRGHLTFSLQRHCCKRADDFLTFIATSLQPTARFRTIHRPTTWRDVVEAIEELTASPANPENGWNIQILGQVVSTSEWMAITPSLSSLLESNCFLGTAVEVLFEFYHTARLYAVTAPLADGNGTEAKLIATTPPPPPKRRHGSSTPATPTKQQTEDESGGSVDEVPEADSPTVTVPQRCLLKELNVAGCRGPWCGPRFWTVDGFLRQQERWRVQCSRLQGLVAKLPTNAAVTLVQEEVRQCRAAIHLPPNSTIEGRKSAAWMISLLEYEAALLIECGAQAFLGHGDRHPDKPADLGDTVHCFLRAGDLSVKVLDILQRLPDILHSGATPLAVHGAAVEPHHWVIVLLKCMQLRCLRHVALLYASHVLPRYRHSALQIIPLISIVEETTQAAEELLAALYSIFSDSAEAADQRFPQHLFSSTLLLCIQSMAELSAFLPMTVAKRCSILSAAIELAYLRLIYAMDQRRDRQWLPHCVTDTVHRMHHQLLTKPFSAAAHQHFMELVGQLHLTLTLSDEWRRCLEYYGQASHQSSLTADPPPATIPHSTKIGYVLHQVHSSAAVDEQFLQSNTVVRQLRKMATYTSPVAPTRP